MVKVITPIAAGLVPENIKNLIDEHTFVIIDLDTKELSVRGKGQLHKL